MRLLLCLGILGLLLLAGCAAHPQTVTFNHVIYRYQSSTDNAQVYQGDAGQILKVETSDQGTRVTADGQVYQVSGTADDLQVVLPGGVEVSRHYDANSSYGGAPLGVDVSFEDWNRVDELRALVFPQSGKSQAAFWHYPFGLLLIGLGLLQVVNPRLAWQISEGWRYANVEPSDIYLALSRVGGVVVVLVGIFILFGAG